MTTIPTQQALVPVSLVRTHPAGSAPRALRQAQAVAAPTPVSQEAEQGLTRVRLLRDQRRPEDAAPSVTAPALGLDSPASRAAVRLTYGQTGQSRAAASTGQFVDLHI